MEGDYLKIRNYRYVHLLCMYMYIPFCRMSLQTDRMMFSWCINHWPHPLSVDESIGHFRSDTWTSSVYDISCGMSHDLTSCIRIDEQWCNTFNRTLIAEMNNSKCSESDLCIRSGKYRMEISITLHS